MPADQLQTLSRAVAVLDCFTQEHSEMGVREIARLVNLSSSATGRLLASLKELGILSQNPNTRAYSMGSRVLSWANLYNSTLDIRNQAMPAIRELHQATRETISLYVLDGKDRVCVERLESPQNVRIVQRIGRRLPLYAGSAGKVILAFLTVERQAEYLRTTHISAFTDKTITDMETMRTELMKTRQQGYAISYGEWVEDAAGVAAPILNQNGEVIGALAISGPIMRFNLENVERYCYEVKRVAAHISTSLGYNPDYGIPSGV
jgi:IclR family transcriptional regulator, KDG regulon repressor